MWEFLSPVTLLIKKELEGIFKCKNKLKFKIQLCGLSITIHQPRKIPWAQTKIKGGIHKTCGHLMGLAVVQIADGTLMKNLIFFPYFQILTWLGYSNSAFNPIIYTIFNSEFRNAFHRILSQLGVKICKIFKCQGTNTTMSENNLYQRWWEIYFMAIDQKFRQKICLHHINFHRFHYFH